MVSLAASRFGAKPSYPILLEYPIEPVPRYGYGKPVHALLNEIIGARRSSYEKTLRAIAAYRERFDSIALEPPEDPAAPHWHNDFFGNLDAASLYFMLATRNPRTYLEVGSGNTTKFARQAIRDLRLRTRVISIDPMPRAEIDVLCDEVRREGLEKTPQSVLRQLEPGDILLVDNSHRVFTNSDVTVFFLDVLPYLKPGVLVHLHDVFLPYDYPPEWSDRHYSEQYMLAAYLLAGPERVSIVLPSAFISLDVDLRRLAEAALPGKVEGAWCGASFWFEIR